jgi:hypothetical protein
VVPFISKNNFVIFSRGEAPTSPHACACRPSTRAISNAVVGVVVGVLVRDEDVTQRGERYASEGEPAGDAVAGSIT